MRNASRPLVYFHGAAVGKHRGFGALNLEASGTALHEATCESQTCEKCTKENFPPHTHGAQALFFFFGKSVIVHLPL